jgi:hypothetical protein
MASAKGKMKGAKPPDTVHWFSLGLAPGPAYQDRVIAIHATLLSNEVVLKARPELTQTGCPDMQKRHSRLVSQNI